MFEVGRVVFCMAGRDKHRFYTVVALGEGFAFIADGKRRKLAAPKRKNILHLRRTDTCLTPEQIRTDKQLRMSLNVFNSDGVITPMVNQEGGNKLV